MAPGAGAAAPWTFRSHRRVGPAAPPVELPISTSDASEALVRRVLKGHRPPSPPSEKRWSSGGAGGST
eukprot:15484779-Alexandrium_andersonii.AAC.1